MSKILVDEDLIVGSLMCCLGMKAIIDTMLTGVEFPQELLEQSSFLIQEILDATPDELREQVINAVLDSAGAENLLEEVSPPTV